MVWLPLRDCPEVNQSAILVDCYLFGEDPRAEYERIAGLFDADLPLEELFADASHKMRLDFHESERRQYASLADKHETCYIYATRCDVGAGQVFPAITKDFAHDPNRDKRMIFILAYKQCPKATRCLQHILEVADLCVKRPDEYSNFRKFRREAIELGQRILELYERFPNSAEQQIKDYCGLAVYAEPY